MLQHRRFPVYTLCSVTKINARDCGPMHLIKYIELAHFQIRALDRCRECSEGR